MKTAIVLSLLLISVALAQEPPAMATDSGTRSKALELAGAFSNDGYRIRDGFWSGEIEAGRPRFLEVNLFAGNEYWFSAAAAQTARKIAVSLHNADGKPAEFQVYSDGPVAAAGAEPSVSGKYFVKIELLEGDKSPFCLLYSYK